MYAAPRSKCPIAAKCPVGAAMFASADGVPAAARDGVLDFVTMSVDARLLEKCKPCEITKRVHQQLCQCTLDIMWQARAYFYHVHAMLLPRSDRDVSVARAWQEHGKSMARAW